MKLLTIDLKDDLHSAFKEKYARESVTMSEVIRMLIKEWIENPNRVWRPGVRV